MLPVPFDLLHDDAHMCLALAKGDHVFRQGDETRGVFFVISGAICLTRITEAGTVVTLHNALAGSMFAEASLYSGHYHCDAVATAQSQVIRLSKHAIQTRQRKDAAFSESITRLLATQVQEYRQLLTLHAVRSAHERVFQAVACGLLQGSVTQFASQIGLTKEACYRALKDLTDQGALRKIGRGEYVLRKSS
ncbi:cyclic nucleotide-binding domain-containing protein [Epibacterium sp. SM1969]|uniref:Cyclic nucleotide-binding domain-containing protein n=1 Tax=Tritonibacter aquimaris TaxID=2663379 RepID=A0A844APF8_9RHOB|nr:Crp/Fnr family transcriptional regulator [Tritonibacter aquimaris]MQY42593.1 cyclic nucleotide-binding domain-containing protein [Tritonibacter aquimaris]